MSQNNASVFSIFTALFLSIFDALLISEITAHLLSGNKFILITIIEMILLDEKVNEKAVLVTISLFEQIGCLPSMVGSSMKKMSNGNPFIMRFFSQGKFQQNMLQMDVTNSSTRLSFNQILNETACFAIKLSNCEEIPDEDLEIYSECKLDSDEKFYGFRQRSNGKVICNAIFDYNVKDFKEGLALVRYKKKYGFINKKGEMIIPPIYDRALSFSDGIALVGLDQKYGFINKSGNIIIPLIYDCNNTCNECQTYNLDIFSEGLAGVKLNNKCGYIDKTGKVIIPFIYDDVEMFSNGLACIRLNEKWGFINKMGQVIVPFIFIGNWKYDKINDPYRNKLGYEYDFDDFCNNAFEFSFKEGLGVLRVDGKFGFIDTSGKVIIPFIYEEAHNFSDGLARVKLNGQYGFIDKLGQEIISFIYDFAEDFSGGLAIVWIYNGTFIGSDEDYSLRNIDKTGKVI